MAEQINVRELFLRNFVIELIRNSKLDQQQDFHRMQEVQEIKKQENKITPVFDKSPEVKRENLIPSIKITPSPNALRIASRMPPIPPPQAPNFQRTMAAPLAKPSGKVMPAFPAQIHSLSKINPLLKDPTVTEIECSGANERLLVKKAGIIQKTQVILSADEIKKILDEFSEKTKIPIIEGTFKAALDNLIMIAVISEILGPRFIIQKKNPFRPLFQ